ncbi:hypothetical protein Lser_V15G29134 [Lactuca serriola]
MAKRELSSTLKNLKRSGGRYGAPRGGFRGGRRGGFSNGDSEDGDHPHRPYERRSGTGRGRMSSNARVLLVGTGERRETEEVVVEGEKNAGSDKPLAEEEATNEKKENAANEPEDKETEDKVVQLLKEDQ